MPSHTVHAPFIARNHAVAVLSLVSALAGACDSKPERLSGSIHAPLGERASTPRHDQLEATNGRTVEPPPAPAKLVHPFTYKGLHPQPEPPGIEQPEPPTLVHPIDRLSRGPRPAPAEAR